MRHCRVLVVIRDGLGVLRFNEFPRIVMLVVKLVNLEQK